MTLVEESLRESNQLTTLLSMKTKTKIASWNVRTMYETGKAAQVAKEMKRYDIQILGICESRWNGQSRTSLASGETVIFSGHTEENHEHTEGVAMMLTPRATSALIEWQQISSRLMTARSKSKGR